MASTFLLEPPPEPKKPPTVHEKILEKLLARKKPSDEHLGDQI